MPGFDKTGPAGAGPKTGRGMGPCGGGQGVSGGMGTGRGFGRGMGAGRGFGGGFGRRFFGWIRPSDSPSDKNGK